MDGERIDRLLSESLPRDRAEIRILTGKDVNADAILSYYHNLKVGRDDALFFYYAGHGATDPQKGHFLAFQDLHAKPLLRADLRRAMQEHQPGLIVLMTDCCSSRFKFPGKTRRVYADNGTASTIQPVMRCLFYQSRGVVDITAATGNFSFGDDHDGGIFTRTFDKVVRAELPRSDADRDGFVSWPEFFSRLQTETEGVFVNWAQHQRALGEDVGQTSQKPHAFELGGRRRRAVRRPAERNAGSPEVPVPMVWPCLLGRRQYSAARSRPLYPPSRAGRAGGADSRGPLRRRQDRRIAGWQDLSIPRLRRESQASKGAITAKSIGGFTYLRSSMVRLFAFDRSSSRVSMTTRNGKHRRAMLAAR